MKNMTTFEEDNLIREVAGLRFLYRVRDYLRKRGHNLLFNFPDEIYYNDGLSLVREVKMKFKYEVYDALLTSIEDEEEGDE